MLIKGDEHCMVSAASVLIKVLQVDRFRVRVRV